jgi:replicative DNA helicase
MNATTTHPHRTERQRPAANHEQLGRLFDKLPPHAMEAECALLGSMILDSNVIGDVSGIIQSPEDFYRPSHAAIYAVLLDLYESAGKIDIVQINQRLRDLGQLDQVGGTDALVALAESVPSAVTAPYYAGIVREKAALRHLITACSEGLQRAYTSADPVADQIDACEAAIFRLAEAGVGAGPQSEAAGIGAILQTTYDDLDRRSREGGTISGLETGFFELDDMLSGLQAGDMVILGARPSQGKTAIALNIAEHVAINRRHGVAVFSMEMSKSQLGQRLLCSRSGVDSHLLRRNMISADDFARLHASIGEMADAPLMIDDTPGLTVMGLRARARRMASRHHVKLIVVDYLQLMSSPGKHSGRVEEVSEISRGIKALARELAVPIICLSQLNRASESREGHRPRMSDLRESGAIEQDADVIMLLHREDYYHKDDDGYQPSNVAEVIVAKQRNGPCGTVRLVFDGGTTRFRNMQQHVGSYE